MAVVTVSAEEEQSIADRVDGLHTIFKSEFVVGGKEKYFVASDGEQSDDEDKVSARDELGDHRDPFTLTPDEYRDMINDFCTRISKKEGDYKAKLDAYHSSRKSDCGTNIATYNGVGADCEVQEVALLAAQCQSRVSSVNGPAGQRNIARQPRVKIRGLTEAETEVVQTNHREKELWNRIL